MTKNGVTTAHTQVTPFFYLKICD